ncbi:hypothetical protein OZX65_00680 [Leuconostocaceae bacterium ESL0723]|nr:hypothetical protein OZX65_00680 [Leuconostocaceae bacterium ESL0723]
MKGTLVLATVVGLTPAAWLIWGIFDPLSTKQYISATLLNVPALLNAGFTWGRYFRDDKIFKLAKEADDLEAELQSFKNQD